MIQVNVAAPVELTYRFLQGMTRRTRPSYILNTSSVIAFTPMPFFVNYAATKAYVQVFSESLAAELEGTNVSVTSLCSGGTRTEFNAAAGLATRGSSASRLMDPADVAAIGLRAMLRRQRHVVPGYLNRLLCVCTRILPRASAGTVAARVLGKPAARDNTGGSH
jgi:short-subunit dehydrogenase